MVLGGGGVSAVAWELGVVAALAESGVDLTSADLIVGTSAGALVGAHIAHGADLRQLYQAQLTAPQPASTTASVRNLLRLSWILLRHRDPLQYRIHVGRFAMAATTYSENDRRSDIASRLTTHAWPPRPLMITAVDAMSGEFVTFSRDQGVPLVDAVTASMAVPGVQPPVTINGRPYLDGGMRSCANADLAAGYERVVVIAPIARGSGPIASVTDQVADLRGRSQVLTVAPDRSSRKAMGWNPTDPRRCPGAARAGHAQAAAVSSTVGQLWCT